MGLGPGVNPDELIAVGCASCEYKPAVQNQNEAID